jgi:hypothetical protein
MSAWKLICRGVRCWGFIAALLAATRPAGAAAPSLSSQDLQVLGSALTFVIPRPAGTLAVVYSATDDASQQDAAAIMTALGKGLPIGGAILTPRLVDAAALGSTDFGLAIIAANANGEAVARSVDARHALCVTADRPAVQRGLCTVAINSAGRVDIFLNNRVAQRAGITFATAFRMMVHEQ